MSVNTLDDFERHGSGALDRIEIATGRTETAFAAKRNEFQGAAFGAAVHGATKGRVATVDHLVNVFDNSLTGM